MTAIAPEPGWLRGNATETTMLPPFAHRRPIQLSAVSYIYLKIKRKNFYDKRDTVASTVKTLPLMKTLGFFGK